MNVKLGTCYPSTFQNGQKDCSVLPVQRLVEMRGGDCKKLALCNFRKNGDGDSLAGTNVSYSCFVSPYHRSCNTAHFTIESTFKVYNITQHNLQWSPRHASKCSEPKVYFQVTSGCIRFNGEILRQTDRGTNTSHLFVILWTWKKCRMWQVYGRIVVFVLQQSGRSSMLALMLLHHFTGHFSSSVLHFPISCSFSHFFLGFAAILANSLSFLLLCPFSKAMQANLCRSLPICHSVSCNSSPLNNQQKLLFFWWTLVISRSFQSLVDAAISKIIDEWRLIAKEVQFRIIKKYWEQLILHCSSKYL